MDIGVSDVRMFPWVGANYAESGFRGRKLLILGESEYEWTIGALQPEIATWLITANANGSKKHRFYTKIYHVFSEEPKWQSLEHFADFWQSVCFYNYIQEKVGTAPRQRPLPEMWPRWKDVFLSVVGKLNPDRILVLGKKLWSSLDDLGLVQIENDGEAWHLKSETTLIKIAYIHHPSSPCFRPASWRQIVANLLV